MKICLVSNEYPPETGWGGIGTYTHALAHGFTEREHSVHVITLSLDQHTHSRMDGLVHVHRIPTYRWPLPGLVRQRGGGIVTLLEHASSVARYIGALHASVRFDVVEAPNWGAEGVIYSLRPTTPLVVRVSTPIHTVATIAGKAQRPRLGLRLHQWLEGLAVRRATTVIAHSKYIAGLASTEYSVPEQSIHVVPLGTARPAPLVLPKAQTPSEATVLYVGRLERRKGVRYLLESIPDVLAAVPNARFHLIGKDVPDAPGGISYQAYFASFAPPGAQARTIFHGFVDQSELEREYAACEIFVAPSLFESFGLIHLEAMARGKPVIAFNTTATPEVVVDGETGLLVQPPSAVGEQQATSLLAQAIIRLLQAPAEARRLGEQGHARALEQFSIERMVDGTMAAYQSAMRRQC